VTRGVHWPLNGVEKGLKLLGQDAELRTVKNLHTTMKLATMFGFYTCPDYIFHNERLMAMADRMGLEDKKLFPVDARRIGWRHYLREVHLAGLNRYALQERKLYRLRAAAKTQGGLSSYFRSRYWQPGDSCHTVTVSDIA